MPPAPAPEPVDGAASPRGRCWTCFRPETHCYCALVPKLATRTRVVVLQHPRERDTAIGTARMASLCLEGAELHVGVRWEGTSALASALGDPARPPILLWPGVGARDLAQEPPEGPVTLVVVDGTWWQAKALVRDNPTLATLPRYTFVPPRPSDYRIRKEPSLECVSTVEATAHALGLLEGDPARFEAMLVPFRALVDRQIASRDTHQAGRERKGRSGAREHARLGPPRVLAERPRDVVCVFGESDVRPYAARRSGDDAPAPLVHWIAHRPFTGETFEAFARPPTPLHPGTCAHVGLDAARIEGAPPVAALLDAWRAWLRDADVLVHWGTFGTSALVRAGGALPEPRVDLRAVLRGASGARFAGLDDVAAADPLPGEPGHVGEGRAGRRLARLVALVRRLVERPGISGVEAVRGAASRRASAAGRDP